MTRRDVSSSWFRPLGVLTATLAAAWLAGPAACGPTRKETAPPRGELAEREELPAPSWRVVARRNGKVLLAANRVILYGIRRREAPERGARADRAREYPTLVFENGRLRTGAPARDTVLVLAAGARRDSLRVYALEFEGRPVLLAQTGEGPALYESPAEPGLYAVERDDRLWLVGPAGVTQLTADAVRGIARDTLESQQREGVRHLFWATGPVWSPDGSAIAYVTNRTWMLTRPSGQEVWLAELRPRRERPLLSERGQFFAPKGWLGSELVYTRREPGIMAIDVRTGARRMIADSAAEVAISLRASRMLYMTAAGDTVRAHVLTERGVVVDVPDPPPGERLTYSGTFSPRGDRLLLETTFVRDSGITRALHVFDVRARRLSPLMRWSFREGTRHPSRPPWVWLDEVTLLLTQLDRATGLESSTLLRLGAAPRGSPGAASR